MPRDRNHSKSKNVLSLLCAIIAVICFAVILGIVLHANINGAIVHATMYKFPDTILQIVAFSSFLKFLRILA